MKKKNYFRWIVALIVLMFSTLATFALYNLLFDMFGVLLFKFGITNTFYQNGLILLIAIIIFLIVGYPFKKILKEVIA